MSPYSITREDAAKDALALRKAIDQYRGDIRGIDRLKELADSIEEQFPAPIPEEPTGDVLLRVFDLTYKRLINGEWWPVERNSSGYEWPDLVAEASRVGSPIKVYRRVSPPTEEVAGFTPKPVESLVGVLTDPDWDPMESLLDQLCSDAIEAPTPEALAALPREFAAKVRALTTEDTVPGKAALLDLCDEFERKGMGSASDYGKGAQAAAAAIHQAILGDSPKAGS